MSVKPTSDMVEMQHSKDVQATFPQLTLQLLYISLYFIGYPKMVGEWKDVFIRSSNPSASLMLGDKEFAV